MTRKISWWELTLFVAIAVGLVVVLPWMGNNGAVSSFTINLWGKYLCYAILAISVDLLWGYTGLLSLGQALFFSLGGYMLGMHLMLMIGKLGQYKSDLPDFMVFLGYRFLPWFWRPFSQPLFALMAVVVVPGLLASAFGYLAFRSRIKGVYFSILTQALTYAGALIFFRNDLVMGGNNGFTDFKFFLGFDLHDEATQRGLFVATAVLLVVVYGGCRWLTLTKLGLVQRAIRDSETRVLFSGYAAANYKLFIFVVAAVIAGLAGALYVPQVGIINPSEMTPDKSLEAVVWCAVGGRGTLYGPILGAIGVNALKSWATRAFPDSWLFILGGLFILVVLFLPKGVVGIPGLLRYLLPRRSARPEPSPGPPVNRVVSTQEAGTRFHFPLPEVDPVTRNGASLHPRAEGGGSLLAAIKVNKTFAGFHAIKDLNFSMTQGELRTVIGPNGAGKTSFLDLVTGRTKPDSGTITWRGSVDLTRLTEYQIFRQGIGRKFQTPTVYSDHTVYENLLLSLEGSRGVWANLFYRMRPVQKDRIAEILRVIKLESKAAAKAGALAHGQKQWLEIGMSLAQNAQLLLVDEPAAGMTDEETERTGELLLSLAGEHSILVIEHDMTFVRQISQGRLVTVLHQGSVLREGTVDEVQNDERVVEVYLGRKHAHHQ